jgi:hypothetical protein
LSNPKHSASFNISTLRESNELLAFDNGVHLEISLTFTGKIATAKLRLLRRACNEPFNENKSYSYSRRAQEEYFDWRFEHA